MDCTGESPRVGWASQAIAQLHAAEPSFEPFIAGAAPLRRQAVFCCLSDLRLPVRLPEQEGTGLDSLAILARMFMNLRARETIQVVYGRTPDGLLGALRRLGASPLERYRYRQILEAFTEPGKRFQARFIRQTTGTISAVSLEAVFGLDPVLVHRNVVEHFYHESQIAQANAALALLRQTSSRMTDQIVRSTIEAGGVADLGRYVWRLFPLMDQPLVSPPIPIDDDDLVVLNTGMAIRAHGRQYRTCIARRIPMVAAGIQAFVAWKRSPGTLAELHRVDGDRYRLFKLHGPYNLPPLPGVADQFRSKLHRLGIVPSPSGYDTEQMMSSLRPIGLHDFAWELGFDVFEADDDARREADAETAAFDASPAAKSEALPLDTHTVSSVREHGLRVCVHRGTREIGGTCIEIEADGVRILLDLGLPLNAADPDQVPLPVVSGLNSHDPSLKAIVLTHGHQDHWGLIPQVTTGVPLVMGAATERIMRAAAPFVRSGFVPEASAHLQNHSLLEIGPFRITPYLVDHSAFDAYAILVEANGRRLFYSGDLRSHGGKGRLFEALIQTPPHDIDVMLMEGSSIGRIDENASFPSEADLEAGFLRRMRETQGLVMVCCSPQNIDRVVTVYRAAKRSGRMLIVDAYAAEVLKATGHSSIPRPAADWPGVKVWLPDRQRRFLVRNGIAWMADGYRNHRIWPEDLATMASKSVMLIRDWMVDELRQRDALHGARLIWSQWEGYLRAGSGAALRRTCETNGIPFEVIHTSGHASPGDLKRLASAIAPRRLVAIHTFQADKYPLFFQNVKAVEDGEWWGV